MSRPRITVGVPVFKCADLMGQCLDSLQRQTFGNFEAIISVDGGDEETAAACRPFLTDPRFRMVVQPERLDWVGNFNWLLQQDLGEFFCYRQHDDTTAPEFFEILLQVADKEPKAAAVYSDCRYNDLTIEAFPSIEGEPLHRVYQYIQRVISAVPVRGLIRRPAIQHAGLVRQDEFRAVMQIGGWLTKLLHWGSFRQVAEPIYYRLYRPESLGNEYQSKSKIWKQAAWATMFTSLLDGAIPICRTPEERLLMQQAILWQVIAYPHFHPNREPSSSATLIAECLKRLSYEGNTHLLSQEEFLTIMERLNWSRMRRAMYRIGNRSLMARMFYPRSKMRRIGYQIGLCSKN